MEMHIQSNTRKSTGRVLHIALCDNNLDWLSTEERYLTEIEGIKYEHNSFENGEELINAYKNAGCSYDIIFMDMEMEQMNGIETANKIRLMDRKVIIVFITNYEKYIMESFECLPFRFMLKPVEFETFKKVLLQAVNLIEEEKQALVFTENRSTVRVLCDDILYLQSKNQCVSIVTLKKEYKTYQPMSELADMLDANLFVTVYKGILVNLQYIYNIENNEITLYGYSKRLPLSRTYKKAVKESLLSYMERKYGI